MISNINKHIEEYLNHYCELTYYPGYAVLIKGHWGCGKTWFINKYIEKLKVKDYRILYVSLYGMTGFSDIEYSFFQQLHPILSSKEAALLGNILKSALRLTLKLDLDQDKKDDGTINLQVPEVNIQKHLKTNLDKAILIFDDLERSKIDINNLLGYINSFVEHQKLKVILIANEDQLAKNNSYNKIKEKLIGMTLGVTLDFDSAIKDCINILNNDSCKEFLSKNIETIKDIYAIAEYQNSRVLKHILLDFNRFFDKLPDKFKNNSDYLAHLLKVFIALSIEIKRGKISIGDIRYFMDEYIAMSCKSIENVKESHDNNSEEIQNVLTRYRSLKLHEQFPSNLFWIKLFEMGIVDVCELEKSALTSKYFRDENTPDWIRLYYFHNLSDDEFGRLIQQVESSFSKKDYKELGEFLHVASMFMKYSKENIYPKEISLIFQESRDYFDYLLEKDFVDNTLLPDSNSYRNLGFSGKDIAEFQQLQLYISEKLNNSYQTSLPRRALDLLEIMKTDLYKFRKIIAIPTYNNDVIVEYNYYRVPIFNFLDPHLFMQAVLFMEFDKQHHIFSSLSERYSCMIDHQALIEELPFLRFVKNLLEVESKNRFGRLSGFLLSSFLPNIVESIRILEDTK